MRSGPRSVRGPSNSCPRFVRGGLQKNPNHRETMKPIRPDSMPGFHEMVTLQDRRTFPYKEEVGGSSPSTPTEMPRYCWAFFVFGIRTTMSWSRFGRE